MKNLKIRNWAAINDSKIIKNGELRMDFNLSHTADQKLESAYRALNVAYPKFFKMDTQSKLGWLTADFMCEGESLLQSVSPTEVALVLSNKKSSLDTDEQYQQSLSNVEEFLPSPAVFVYTLANIVAGEICIRHGIKGENNFMISESFDPNALVNYTQMLFEEDLCQKCIVGWVEAYKGTLRSFFVLVEPASGEPIEAPFSVEFLKQLYQISEL